MGAGSVAVRNGFVEYASGMVVGKKQVKAKVANSRPKEATKAKLGSPHFSFMLQALNTAQRYGAYTEATDQSPFLRQFPCHLDPTVACLL